MIELIERTNIFENKKIIASEICKIQKVWYDDEIYNECNENEKNNYIGCFDALNYNVLPINNYYQQIISLNKNDEKYICNKLSEKLSELFNEIEIDKLYLLNVLKTDIFGGISNKYRPLQNSYKKLYKIITKKEYTEAFYLDKIFVKDIIEIVYWLSRCDPNMSNILFFDFNEKCYFNICQYGNIHFTGINQNIITEEILHKSEFKILEKC